MEKGQRKPTVWMVLVRGAAVVLGAYLAGATLLAALLVRGSVPETTIFPILAVLCVLAALAGGLLCARGTPLRPLPGALLCGLIVITSMLCVGGCWNGVRWTGRTATLLLCVLGGSLTAGIVGNRARRKGKRRRRL